MTCKGCGGALLGIASAVVAPVAGPTAIARLAVCAACERRYDWHGHDRCAECRCFLALKVRSRTSDCPLGKWSAPEAEAATPPRP